MLIFLCSNLDSTISCFVLKDELIGCYAMHVFLKNFIYVFK